MRYTIFNTRQRKARSKARFPPRAALQRETGYMPSQSNYLERTVLDDSGITLTHEKAGTAQETIPVLRPALHQHHFYEITLVLRGSCEFFFNQGRMSLIPGDLLMLPPDRPHTCHLQPGAQLCCCSSKRKSSPARLQRPCRIWYTGIYRSQTPRKNACAS